MAPKSNGQAKAKAKAPPPAKKAGTASAKRLKSKKAPSSAKTPKDPPRATRWSWRRNVLANNKKPEQIAGVPYTLDDERDAEWPSALFLDATYKNGVLVSKKANEEDYFVEAKGYTNCPERSVALGERSLPCLTKIEAEMWCQKHAANTAVARRFPVEAVRLLGTISLEIQAVQKGKKKDPMPPQKSNLSLIIPRPANYKFSERVKKISQKQAQTEATAEAQQQITSSDDLQPSLIFARGAEIQQQWAPIQSAPAHYETWHAKSGLLPLGQNDDKYIHLHDLKSWLQKGMKAGTLKDLKEGATKTLYGGLTKVPVSAMDILNALVDLSEPTPCGYGVPLLVAYPRIVSRPGKKKKANNILWKIQMGIYMHRLLPEVLTIQTLHTVMSALDEGSYTVSQPISLPPKGGEVFASAPYPKVDMSWLEYGGQDDGSDVEIIDVDMEGGDRDELLISPFSTKGLLKLLENKGSDVSNVSNDTFLEE